jgi:hypothetical protein
LRLVTITLSTDDKPLSLTLPLKPNSDQAKVTVVEVKDLKADHCY